MSRDLLTRARAWLADDPDPATRAELEELLRACQDGDEAALAELADCFSGLLEFGTAGLRGAMGPGPNRMNRAVVIRAAAGLGRYLLDRGPVTGLPRPRVVVGFDARHRSADFAADTAAVLTAAGLDVLCWHRALPTPLLAWAVRHFDADAGVMVTASHNPPQDNGYKVYLGGPGEEGSLIVPPADQEISARIAQIGTVAGVLRAPDGWAMLDEAHVEDYLHAAADVAPKGSRDLSIVITSLHGVGGGPLKRVLSLAGFDQVIEVDEQAAPDPDFPTVAFPNPEEPGALDLAIAQAWRCRADIVIANDPDADRCAVALKDPHGPAETDGWRMLRGDEVGAVLGQYIASQSLPGSGTLACSIVSATVLLHIAAAHQLDSRRTLTGFKWISRVPRLRYGYEEALGYCVAPDLVRDKDGLTAAVMICHIAALEHERGRSLLDIVDDIGRAHGLHTTLQVSARFTDLAEREAVLARLLERPPAVLGSVPVTEVDDLSTGWRGLPPTEGIRLQLGSTGWVLVRPSGTEPKLKAYLEVVVPVGRADVWRARQLGRMLLSEIGDDVATYLSLEKGG